MWQRHSLAATTREINMTKSHQKKDTSALPEPIVLTLDQLKDVASATASGVAGVSGGAGPIKSGGIKALQ
jgi:hypothetical protein